MNRLDTLESFGVDLVAKIAPWCAPAPTAYLVGRATVLHLAWPVAVGVVAALVVESLGLATTATALTLYEYNRSRRKLDTPAPFWLAAVLVLVYFVVATGLTVALDILPGLVRYAPAIFPTLSLVGVTVLALRSDHRRRLESIAQERAERKAKRQAARQSIVKPAVIMGDSLPVFTPSLDVANRTRKAKQQARIGALLDFYRLNPLAGPTEAGQAVGVSRQTVHAYLENLEQAGRIRRNGHGVEVAE